MINSVTLSITKEKNNIIILFLLSLISLASPIMAHYFKLKGNEFLPIFFALSSGAYILSPTYLIALSIISPIINYFFTDMPMPPILYFLIFEGLIFSIIISMLKNTNISFIISAPISLIIARLSSVILVFIFNMNIDAFFKGFINGYKGIIVNSIFAIAVYFLFKDNNIQDNE